METVKGVVEAAEKAIWGDNTPKSGEEPVSGVQGEGTASDPYDAGNASCMNRISHLFSCLLLSSFRGLR